MNEANFTHGVEQAWTNFITFLPKLALAIVILVVGYFVARFLGKLFDAALRRIGFDRLVERGGIQRALSRTQYHASGLVGKIVFYALLLFVLHLAFDMFGPNPVSDLLSSIIAFLPSLFVALVIVVLSALIATAVKDILQATLAGLSYGKFLANLVAIAIVTTGIFAALSEINIAPAIVNGLFYALLAAAAGSAIVAIGGGGIVPMRGQWEKWLGRMEKEAPNLRERFGQRAARARQPGTEFKENQSMTTEKSSEQRSFPQ
jgi:hypothetical protein